MGRMTRGSTVAAESTERPVRLTRSAVAHGTPAVSALPLRARAGSSRLENPRNPTAASAASPKALTRAASRRSSPPPGPPRRTRLSAAHDQPAAQTPEKQAAKSGKKARANEGPAVPGNTNAAGPQLPRAGQQGLPASPAAPQPVHAAASSPRLTRAQKHRAADAVEPARDMRSTASLVGGGAAAAAAEVLPEKPSKGEQVAETPTAADGAAAPERRSLRQRPEAADVATAPVSARGTKLRKAATPKPDTASAAAAAEKEDEDGAAKRSGEKGSAKLAQQGRRKSARLGTFAGAAAEVVETGRGAAAPMAQSDGAASAAVVVLEQRQRPARNGHAKQPQVAASGPATAEIARVATSEQGREDKAMPEPATQARASQRRGQRGKVSVPPQNEPIHAEPSEPAAHKPEPVTTAVEASAQPASEEPAAIRPQPAGAQQGSAGLTAVPAVSSLPDPAEGRPSRQKKRPLKLLEDAGEAANENAAGALYQSTVGQKRARSSSHTGSPVPAAHSPLPNGHASGGIDESPAAAGLSAPALAIEGGAAAALPDVSAAAAAPAFAALPDGLADSPERPAGKRQRKLPERFLDTVLDEDDAEQGAAFRGAVLQSDDWSPVGESLSAMDLDVRQPDRASGWDHGFKRQAGRAWTAAEMAPFMYGFGPGPGPGGGGAAAAGPGRLEHVLNGGRKRSLPIGELIARGLLRDGDLLRYRVKGKLLAVGRAHADGIEVHGSNARLSYTQFEAHAGSKLHRPCEHTFTLSGKSLQELIMECDDHTAATVSAWAASFHPIPELQGVTQPNKILEIGLRGLEQALTKRPEAGQGSKVAAQAALDALATKAAVAGEDGSAADMDPNDSECRMCGQDGELVCCEACPATFHAACLGLAGIPEGDWFCPACTCPTCGSGSFGPALALPQQVCWVDAEAGSQLVHSGTPSLPALVHTEPPSPSAVPDAPGPSGHQSGISQTAPARSGDREEAALEGGRRDAEQGGHPTMAAQKKRQRPEAAPLIECSGMSGDVQTGGADEEPLGMGSTAGSLNGVSNAEAVARSVLMNLVAAVASLSEPRAQETAAAMPSMGGLDPSTIPAAGPANGLHVPDQPGSSGAHQGILRDAGAVLPAEEPVSKATDAAGGAQSRSKLGDPGQEGPDDSAGNCICGGAAADGVLGGSVRLSEGDGGTVNLDPHARPGQACAPVGGPATAQEATGGARAEVHPHASSQGVQNHDTNSGQETAAASGGDLAGRLSSGGDAGPGPSSSAKAQKLKRTRVPSVWESGGQAPHRDAPRPGRSRRGKEEAGSSGLRRNGAGAVADGKGVQPSHQLDPSLLVICPSTGRRHHLGCLPPADQDRLAAASSSLARGETAASDPALLAGSMQLPGNAGQEAAKGCAWPGPEADSTVGKRLAELCTAGRMGAGMLADGTPLHWQLLRGAALGNVKACRGYAPRHSQESKAELLRDITAARAVLEAAFQPLQDSRTASSLLPLLMQGYASEGGEVDWSGFHVAVLWAGSSIASATVLRCHGSALAEVPLLATRAELRGNRLARTLVKAIETSLHNAGVSRIVMPGLPPSATPAPSPAAAAAPTPSAPDASHAPPAPPIPQLTLPHWFGLSLGYGLPTEEQRRELCRAGLLWMPGCTFLLKELSPQTIVQAKPLGRASCGALVLNMPELSVPALRKAGLLTAQDGGYLVRRPPLPPQGQMPSRQQQLPRLASPADAAASKAPEGSTPPDRAAAISLIQKMMANLGAQPAAQGGSAVPGPRKLIKKKKKKRPGPTAAAGVLAHDADVRAAALAPLREHLAVERAGADPLLCEGGGPGSSGIALGEPLQPRRFLSPEQLALETLPPPAGPATAAFGAGMVAAAASSGLEVGANGTRSTPAAAARRALGALPKQAHPPGVVASICSPMRTKVPKRLPFVKPSLPASGS